MAELVTGSVPKDIWAAKTGVGGQTCQNWHVHKNSGPVGLGGVYLLKQIIASLSSVRMAISILPELAKLPPYDPSLSGSIVGRMDKKPAPTIRDLYPDLSDEQLAEVEDSLERYLALVMRIFNRLESETDSRPQLTANDGGIPCSS